MDVIHSRWAATDRGLRALGRDLRAFDGQGDPRVQRPAVVRRLLAAGASADLLDAVLPGWSRYVDDRAPATVGTARPLSAAGGDT